jgi:PKD domain
MTAISVFVLAWSFSAMADADVAHFAAGHYDGIAFDAQGDVFLSDPDAGLVSKFTSSGTLLAQYGHGGGITFSAPHGMTTLPNGDIVVTDQHSPGATPAQVMTPDGAAVGTLGVGNASDVAADPAGNTYFANGPGTITKVAADGVTTTTLQTGRMLGRFDSIAYDPVTTDLYAVDLNPVDDTRGIEFTTAGVFVRAFGPISTLHDASTNYVSAGPSGNLFVTGGDGAIAEFTADGTFVAAFAPGQNESFLGRIAYLNGALYVNDTGFGVDRIDLSEPIAALSVTGPGSPVQTSQAVTLDASGSRTPFSVITRYEFDLDGDGVYETDSGTNPTIADRFTQPGQHDVGVRVTAPSGETDTKRVTVSVVASAARLSAPSTALTGNSVTFDASASALAGSDITDVAFDLDGDGSYETDTGTALSVARAFAHPGLQTVGVRVSRSGGVVDTATTSVDVRAAPPVGPVGVSIDDGATYTNDPNVTLKVTWPAFAANVIVSNDGGFADAGTFPVAAAVPWKLDSSGPERLPKTVYARFDDGTQTFQDDIILDETPPTISEAEVTSAGGSGSSRAAISAAAKTYHVKLRASDKTSGVAVVQIAVTTKKPTKAVAYKSTLTVRGVEPKYVRVQDRAGNYTKWRKLSLASKHRAKPHHHAHH